MKFTSKKGPWYWDKEVETDKRNGSYLVTVLNFFHFRQGKLRRSWYHEEPLVWELIRALDILPRNIFINEFLLLFHNTPCKNSFLINKLREQADSLIIEGDFKLGYLGRKQNIATDICITNKQYYLLIEAKIKNLKEKKLKEQIQKEQNSPFCKKNKCCVIALLPNKEANIVSITWDDVITALDKSEEKLKSNFKEEIIKGYLKMILELRNRIHAALQLHLIK
ncbi:MAG: hypothetical protein WC852_02595 [Candidatus Nanoarchaeia archaeon]|jgi:hypothetical protein